MGFEQNLPSRSNRSARALRRVFHAIEPVTVAQIRGPGPFFGGDFHVAHIRATLDLDGTPPARVDGIAIMVPSNAGWDYLWVRYEKIEDAGFVFPTPVLAYVEKVYERFAFAQLFGLG